MTMTDLEWIQVSVETVLLGCRVCLLSTDPPFQSQSSLALPYKARGRFGWYLINGLQGHSLDLPLVS